MKRSLLSITGIVLLTLIVVLLNGISQTALGGLNFDLTEDKLFSLSNGTKNIIKSIDEPIKLKLYFSKTDAARSPAVKLYGARVTDLLREYSRVGGGKIDLEVYDPRPDTEEEEWAQKYGLNPVQTPEGDKIFFGLAGVNATGNEASIPFFNFARQEFLEYDVTKMLYSLLSNKKPKIGVISSLNIRGQQQQPQQYEDEEQGGEWYALNLLKQMGDVTVIDGNASDFDPSLDLLVVIHPKNVSDSLLYSIDQFVLKGGKLLAAVDPFAQADIPEPNKDNPAAAMSADRSSSLNKLTTAWGVEQIPGKILGDRAYSMKVATGPSREPVPFVAWVGVPKQSFDGEDVVTSSLEQMVFAWPGALTIKQVDGEVIETLASSSKETHLYDSQEFVWGGGDPEKMLQNFSSEGKSYPIAVRISGKLKTAFPEGKPGLVQPSAGQAKNDQLKVSGGASNVIIVADVDFLTDRFSIQRQNFLGTQLVSLFNDNQVFFQNAVENLNGSEDLISLRSRGRFSRPFTKVQRLEREAQEKFQQEEMVLQAKLNSATQRLNALQNQTGGQQGGKQVMSQAVLDEIKQFRDERKQAQDRLREVRRDLRQDIEGLGQTLFLICTFLMPLILILISVACAFNKRTVRPVGATSKE